MIEFTVYYRNFLEFQDCHPVWYHWHIMIALTRLDNQRYFAPCLN